MLFTRFSPGIYCLLPGSTVFSPVPLFFPGIYCLLPSPTVSSPVLFSPRAIFFPRTPCLRPSSSSTGGGIHPQNFFLLNPLIILQELFRSSTRNLRSSFFRSSSGPLLKSSFFRSSSGPLLRIFSLQNPFIMVRGSVQNPFVTVL